MTPISTPPNILSFGLLRDSGHGLTFLEWTAIGAPLSISALCFLFLLLSYLLPVTNEGKTVSASQQFLDYFRDERSKLGAMTRAQKQVASAFGLAIFLWLSPDLLRYLFPSTDMLNNLLSRVSPAVVSVGAALLLFILPTSNGERNLETKDLEVVPWGTVLLFGGGLCLAQMLAVTGLGTEIVGALFRPEIYGVILVGIFAAIVTLVLSEFASNTVAAAILLPLILSSPFLVERHDVLAVCLASTFGAGFGFMLPVSTPPNAIVYATGRLPAATLRKLGISYDIGGIVLISILIVLRLNLGS